MYQRSNLVFTIASWYDCFPCFQSREYVQDWWQVSPNVDRNQDVWEQRAIYSCIGMHLGKALKACSVYVQRFYCDILGLVVGW